MFYLNSGLTGALYDVNMLSEVILLYVFCCIFLCWTLLLTNQQVRLCFHHMQVSNGR